MIWIVAGFVYGSIGFGVGGGEAGANKTPILEAVLRGILWPWILLLKIGNAIAYW